MQIKRIIEVWEKDMNGALVGEYEVSANVAAEFLLRLFEQEAQRPDPKMLLSYFLGPDKIQALQPYVAERLDFSKFDYILSAIGVPEEM